MPSRTRVEWHLSCEFKERGSIPLKNIPFSLSSRSLAVSSEPWSTACVSKLLLVCGVAALHVEGAAGHFTGSTLVVHLRVVNKRLLQVLAVTLAAREGVMDYEESHEDDRKRSVHFAREGVMDYEEPYEDVAERKRSL
ncbi:hypothetical protein BKA93DRAFT_825033 [Sparassis latifolia]